jgi:hypothetical protein
MPSHTTSYNSAMADRRMSSANEAALLALPTVVLRRLPRRTTAEAVRTMLLFAKDLQDTEIVANENDDDAGFVTAVARFASIAGAAEVQAMLNGKPNTAGQAKMIVEIAPHSAFISGPRRNTIDQLSGRKFAQSVSPPTASIQKLSRFNGAFQSLDPTSPNPIGSPLEQAISDSSSQAPPMFSPQSPPAVSGDRSRSSGRKNIAEDRGDEETGELLKESMPYSSSNRSQQIPTSAFASLSLNTTNIGNGSAQNYVSPRSAAGPRTPHPQFQNIGPNGQYTNSSQPYLRHNYPPVNPADQNPPCNTLYVGNLPIDTSEDELKAMFSKQRGYKRLCFRTKQNGPMCFVEFEDISFATKALNELYGAQLHNSVKGGIRLSFSKNPLGVRAGQPGSGAPSTPLIATGSSIHGFGNSAASAFASAAGPPPGLSPPALNMGMPTTNGIPPPGAFVNQGFMGSGNGANLRGLPPHSSAPGMNGMYPDYMLGR